MHARPRGPAQSIMLQLQLHAQAQAQEQAFVQAVILRQMQMAQASRKSIICVCW